MESKAAGEATHPECVGSVLGGGRGLVYISVHASFSPPHSPHRLDFETAAI